VQGESGFEARAAVNEHGRTEQHPEVDVAFPRRAPLGVTAFEPRRDQTSLTRAEHRLAKRGRRGLDAHGQAVPATCYRRITSRTRSTNARAAGDSRVPRRQSATISRLSGCSASGR